MFVSCIPHKQCLALPGTALSTKELRLGGKRWEFRLAQQVPGVGGDVGLGSWVINIKSCPCLSIYYEPGGFLLISFHLHRIGGGTVILILQMRKRDSER